MLHHILSGWSNQGGWDGQAWSMHRRDEKCTQNFGQKIWRDHSEDLGVDGEVILEWILGEKGRKLLTGCVWLRLEFSGRHLWAR